MSSCLRIKEEKKKQKTRNKSQIAYCSCNARTATAAKRTTLSFEIMRNAHSICNFHRFCRSPRMWPAKINCRKNKYYIIATNRMPFIRNYLLHAWNGLFMISSGSDMRRINHATIPQKSVWHFVANCLIVLRSYPKPFTRRRRTAKQQNGISGHFAAATTMNTNFECLPGRNLQQISMHHIPAIPDKLCSHESDHCSNQIDLQNYVRAWQCVSNNNIFIQFDSLPFVVSECSLLRVCVCDDVHCCQFISFHANTYVSHSKICCAILTKTLERLTSSCRV